MSGRSSHWVPGIQFRLLAHVPKKGEVASARCKTSDFFLWMQVIFRSTSKFKNSDTFLNLSPCLVLWLLVSVGCSNMECSRHTQTSSATPWSGHTQVTKDTQLRESWNHSGGIVVVSTEQRIYFPIRLLRPHIEVQVCCFFSPTLSFVLISVFSSPDTVRMSPFQEDIPAPAVLLASQNRTSAVFISYQVH